MKTFIYHFHKYTLTYIIDTCVLTLYSGIDAISSDSVEMGGDTFNKHTYIHTYIQTCMHIPTYVH